jgi:hypothetical protein
MSLNYELTKIKDWKDLINEDGSVKGITEVLIFATMAVGIGHITQKNFMKFFERLRAHEAVSGPMTRERREIVHHEALFRVLREAEGLDLLTMDWDAVDRLKKDNPDLHTKILELTSHTGGRVTKEHVERHIGLTTNVSDETDAWFVKKIGKSALRSA